MTGFAGRQIWSIEGNSQRLDGGAMFGNAPRDLWQRWLEPDDHNRIPLACRAMLLREPGGRLVLFEAGIGAFLSPALRSRYGVEQADDALAARLAAAGFAVDQVEVVVLSHLHFDHAGGVLAPWVPNKPIALSFPRATFVVSDEALARARAPHARDRASFVAGLADLLEASGRLEVIPRGSETSPTLGPGYRLHRSQGHTPGLLAAEIEGALGPLLYAADLIPGRFWLHLPITMGYDRAPELLVDEKRALLEDLASRGGRVFFTHDPEVCLATPVRGESGRFGAGETWREVSALEL
jgi:glyoxylase-like metal-dependent hydrolase (beta-lactamase superfamily II)